ncbi:MAG: class I SAM-dependent methyltransferase [Patescibacteria group bacterium]|nr:class I SAM-dependent methyltransferase [Patescibacteria group bacterium]
MKNNIYSPYQKLASFYDKTYDGKFYFKYANFISKLAKKNKIKNPIVLDLACGTGSLIKELNKKLKNVEGADISTEMLQVAKLKNPKNKFYSQSFQDLHLNKTYDIITCTFDSINYLLKKEDLYRTIKNISRHLKNNGLFIFDFNTTNKKIDSKFINNNIIFNNSINKNYWDAKIEIIEDGKANIENHRERLYTLKEIENVLEKYGIKIIELYSNFNEQVNEKSKSNRLFVIAKKIK